jgi:hypothetical protein
MCETVPALDVRRLGRNGQLRPGGTSVITWACDGEPCASIRLSAEANAVLLAFQTEDGALVRQRVPLTWTGAAGGANAHGLFAMWWPPADAAGGDAHCST